MEGSARSQVQFVVHALQPVVGDPSTRQAHIAGVVGARLQLLRKQIQGVGYELGRHDAVEGGRVPALLQVADRRMAHVVQAVPLLGEDLGEHIQGVVLARPLVADHQVELAARAEGVHHAR